MKMYMSIALVIGMMAGWSAASDDLFPSARCGEVTLEWVDEFSCTNKGPSNEDNCVPFNDMECGWGYSQHIYDCTGHDGSMRTCDYDCCKHCPGDAPPPRCVDINLEGCVNRVQTPCDPHCGVGDAHTLWDCGDKNIECIEECCCDRCTSTTPAPGTPGTTGVPGPTGTTGAPGTPGTTSDTQRRCNDENIVSLSMRPWRCPNSGHLGPGK